MRHPPLTRQNFEDTSHRILSEEASVSPSELSVWMRGRDWLAKRLIGDDPRPGRRRYPRAKVSIPAHIAGIGNAVTEDISFRGMALRAAKLPKIRSGEEQSIRLSILGRSIYAIGTVVWFDASRLGLSISAIHPSDELALQAAVCAQHLDRWID